MKKRLCIDDANAIVHWYLCAIRHAIGVVENAKPTEYVEAERFSQIAVMLTHEMMDFINSVDLSEDECTLPIRYEEAQDD